MDNRFSDEISKRNFSRPSASVSGRISVEIPTLLVAFTVYVGYGALTWSFSKLPLWAFSPLCTLCLTWFGSLQHETIHHHPTRLKRLNRWMVCLPLTVWIPYRLYAATHLKHHRHGGRYLTDVDQDPESFYARPGTLMRVGPLGRCLYAVNNTLAGRLILGPALSVCRFWGSELRALLSADSRRLIIWSRHFLGVVLVFAWLQVCKIPIETYLVLVVYPSIALTHLRSFGEHRAHPQAVERTVTVEAGRFWSILFLHNNLHIAHHAYPHLPWYRLPSAWRAMRAESIERGLVKAGYAEIARRHWLRPMISTEHPLAGLETPKPSAEMEPMNA